MLISQAHAQTIEAPVEAPAIAPPEAPSAVTSSSTGAVLPPPEAPSAMEAFIWNMGLVAMLVAMFYLLLIRPQQRRFKEHTEMLRGLKKGDRVVAGGGLVGVIEKITDGEDEVIVDLGGGVKVTALRDMIQKRPEAKAAAGRGAAKTVEKK